MTTLVIKAEGVISNPQYGKVPDLDAGLRFALDARELNLVEDANVTSWVASKGKGLLSEKTFDNKFASYNYPKFKTLAGRPSVVFAGNEVLFNNNDDEHFVKPVTYVVVGQVNNLSPAQPYISRLFDGDRGADDKGISQYHGMTITSNSLRPSSHDDVTDATIYGDYLAVGNDPFVAVFVFDGANSKALVSTISGIKKYPMGDSAQDRIYLGASSVKGSDSLMSALEGNISFFAQYERAMTDDDMQSALDYFVSDFGL